MNIPMLFLRVRRLSKASLNQYSSGAGSSANCSKEAQAIRSGGTIENIRDSEPIETTHRAGFKVGSSIRTGQGQLGPRVEFRRKVAVIDQQTPSIRIRCIGVR